MPQFINEIEDISDPDYRARHQHEFGRRLLTTVIDDRAQRNHPRPFASIANSANPKDGYRDISYRLFASAIDRCAWWMKQQLSLSDHAEPLMYVGSFDLRYQILAMAAVKTGYVMFFPSPRNTPEAQISLIDDAKITKILMSSGAAFEALTKPIVQQRSLQTFVVPELDELLAADNEVAPFEFKGSFDEYRMRPWIFLHTSGSTGFPKIIPIKHGYATSFDAYWMSPNESDLFATVGQKRMFVPFPPFHMAGIVINTACALFLDATVVTPPLGAPLTAEVVHDICVNAKVEFVNLPPFVLMDMIKNPVYLECLRGMKDIAYGGGPLPQETGDKLSEFARITSYYGSTEACIALSLLRPREHWKYFKFDAKFAGVDFRPVEKTTNLYEFVFVRDPKLSLIQAIFVTFPDIDEYRTKDLFSKHPTEPDLWRYEGRLDDMIVLSNAEKFNPVAMEGTITSCPSVKGALVVGTGRFQTALLVEFDSSPESGNETKEEMLDLIWPYVDMANQQCPTYGRVSRELIGFCKPETPLVRAGKGTIQRAPSLQLYSKEIDDLYAHADQSHHQQPVQHAPKSFESAEENQDFLRRWFLQKTRLGEVGLEHDFFNNGMDSLDVVNLTRQISATGRDVSPKFIYNNPTIKQLALSLSEVRNGQENDTADDREQLTKMQQMFQDLKFQATKPTQNGHSTTNGVTNVVEAASKHVVLIGSTGSLGPYLLDGLLANPTVTKVTCLNRSSDALLRQKSKHSTLSLVTDFSKVSFLKSNLSESNLGLKDSDHKELLQSATHIVHNAWTVNFNQHVSSFKPLLEGVRNVISFTHACMPHHVRLFFMSSVSVADKLRVEQQGDRVSETPLDDWSLAKMGYGQSKLVAEGLITDAVDRYGIDAAICRLCQLGGPVSKKGEWNRAEWIPSLVLSSKTIGILPKSLGPMDMVDWLPIDRVAEICLELLFDNGAKNTQTAHQHHQNGDHTKTNGNTVIDQDRITVWHVTNPNPTLWSELLPSMLPFMPKTVETTSFAEWVDLLERGSNPSSKDDAWDPDTVPSLKLLPLFRRLREEALKHPSALPDPLFETERTVACSKTLAQIPAVHGQWVELWMKQWEI